MQNSPDTEGQDLHSFLPIWSHGKYLMAHSSNKILFSAFLFCVFMKTLLEITFLVLGKLSNTASEQIRKFPLHFWDQPSAFPNFSNAMSSAMASCGDMGLSCCKHWPGTFTDFCLIFQMGSAHNIDGIPGISSFYNITWSKSKTSVVMELHIGLVLCYTDDYTSCLESSPYYQCATILFFRLWDCDLKNLFSESDKWNVHYISTENKMF